MCYRLFFPTYQYCIYCKLLYLNWYCYSEYFNVSKSSPEKMFERNLLHSLVSHVSAYAKSHNNLSVCTKSRINPQVALHDVKFSIRCAHKLTPVSYANFEIFFEKCVQLRGKIYLFPQDRKTNGTKNSCMSYLLTIFGDLNKQTIIASSYTKYSV